jgi:hypothetical protein
MLSTLLAHRAAVKVQSGTQIRRPAAQCRDAAPLDRPIDQSGESTLTSAAITI